MSKEKPTLGDAIEDEYYANQGIRTGSPYNDYLVTQRELSKKPRTNVGAGHGGSNGFLSDISNAVDDFFDLIPTSVHYILAATSFGAAFGYALYSGEPFVQALLLGFVGFGALVLCYATINIALKIVIICLGIGLGVLVAFGIVQMFVWVLDLFSRYDCKMHQRLSNEEYLGSEYYEY